MELTESPLPKDSLTNRNNNSSNNNNNKMPKLVSASSYAGTPASSTTPEDCVINGNTSGTLNAATLLAAKNSASFLAALQQQHQSSAGTTTTEFGESGGVASIKREAIDESSSTTSNDTTCERCGQSFPSRIDMFQHRINEHGIDASSRPSASPLSTNAQQLQGDSNNNLNQQQHIQTQLNATSNLLNQFLQSNLQMPFFDLDNINKLALQNGQFGVNGVSNVSEVKWIDSFQCV